MKTSREKSTHQIMTIFSPRRHSWRKRSSALFPWWRWAPPESAPTWDHPWKSPKKSLTILIMRPPLKIPPLQELSKMYFQAQHGTRTGIASKCQGQTAACLCREERWLLTLMTMSEMPSSDGSSFWGGCGEVFFTRTSFPFLVSPFHWLCLWAGKSVLPCNGELAYLCVGVRKPLINIKPHHYLILVYSEIFLNRCHGKFIEKEHNLLQK